MYKEGCCQNFTGNGLFFKEVVFKKNYSFDEFT